MIWLLVIYLWTVGGYFVLRSYRSDTHDQDPWMAIIAFVWPFAFPVVVAYVLWQKRRLERAKGKYENGNIE